MWTWRTKLGLIVIAVGAAWVNGDLIGALGVLGAWLIWDDLTWNTRAAG